MMSFLKKFTPQNFRKGILIIEKLLILLVTSAAYLGMLELFYSAVCTDFSKILILVLLYLVIFVLLFSAYGCWKIGILRLKELIFSFLLLFGLNTMLKYVGIIIPINYINLMVTYFLGAFGIISLIIIKFFVI